MGCQYYVGDYKRDKFFPEVHGRMTWNDNAFFAPEALIDGNGRQIMWSWIFDDRPDSLKKYNRWTGTYGLPRSLWVGEDGTLRMRPVKELETLRMNETLLSNVKVNSGSEVKLNDLGSELMELEVTIQPNNASQYGIKVCVSEDGREETVVSYDGIDKKLEVDTRKSGLGFGRKILEEAPFELKKDEPLVLRIFIDKSIIEVYANNRQAITRRIYPTLGGTGITLFSNGVDINKTDNAGNTALIISCSRAHDTNQIRGCYESEDTGITRMGRQVITEMNRIGRVIDMSHSALNVLPSIDRARWPRAMFSPPSSSVQ